MATAHGLSQNNPGWTQQRQLLQAKEQMPWQVNSAVSLFPLNGQNLDPAHIRQLHQDWVASLQATDQKLPSTEETSSDPSRQGSEEVLTLKEKNRRAQQKFRAKQKAKLSEAESRASDLADQLQDLKTQLAAAESRNIVLEKVFELQSSTPLGLSSNTASTNTKSADDQPSTSGSELVPYNICNPISMPVDINAILNTRKEQQALIQFTPSELKSLEWMDFVKLWKEYVSRLAIGLVDANGQNDSPAAKRVETILDEVLQFFCYLSASHPKKAMQFKHLKLDNSGCHDEGPSAEMWRSIAKALNLDEQQQLQICGSRQYLVSNLNIIMKEREEISAQLVSAVPSQGGRGLQQQLATGHIQARRATERLHQNLQQAQDVLSRFQIASKAIMTPLQVAMVCVQAYPWMPDILALTNAVAKLREGGEEPCTKKPTRQVKDVL